MKKDKFSRDVIFKVFAVNWQSAKISSSIFHWENFGLHQSESMILVNSYMATFDTCEG